MKMGQCTSKNQHIHITHLDASSKKASSSKRIITSTSKRSTTNPRIVAFEPKQIKSTKSCSDSSHQSIDSTLTRHPEDQREISEDFIVLPKIYGYGVAGSVRKAIHRETVETYAVKTIDKTKAKRLDRIQREVSFLRQIDHPNIIHTHKVFEDDTNVHIVTEMCYGGELFDKIVAKAQKGKICFSEAEAARIIFSLLSAISYLHKRDICHRDIKPENILFKTKDADSDIKLIDFGLAIRHRSGQKPLSNLVGTSYYMAPEVLNGSYDKSCDIWSIGAMTYVMLTGRPPFNGPNDDAIFEKIKSGILDFTGPVWDEISDAAKDFIRCLMRMDPLTRWDADMALQHAWLRDALLEEKIGGKDDLLLGSA